MIAVPGKSICKIFSFQVASTGFAAAGVLKNMKITIAEHMPIGRFM
jgi:hypothetical protein